MPGTIRLGAVLALLAAAVALPGCGSDEISGEIPPGNATDLNSALASLSEEVATGCTDPGQAQDLAQAFVTQVNLLPQDSGEVKQELQEAANHLRLLVEEECASTEPTTTTQSTAPATSSSSTETSTTETSTTETSTTETSTGTTTGTDEPPQGNGNGPPDGVPPGNGGTGGTGGPSDGNDE